MSKKKKQAEIKPKALTKATIQKISKVQQILIH